MASNKSIKTERSSRSCSSAHSSSCSGSIQAQLRSKAAAAKFEVECEEQRIALERKIHDAEFQLRSVQLKMAADKALLECEEYERCLHEEAERESINIRTPQPELHSTERVEQYLATNSRPTKSYVHSRGGTVVDPPRLSSPDSQFHLESFLDSYSRTNIQVAETLARSQLPRMDFDKFSGDPCSYTSWKRSALSQLSLAMSNTERLIRLSKMVEKDPAEIVKQYSDRFPNQAKVAYEKVWEVLDHRYGRSSVVADCLLAKLMDVKKISESDYDALRKFSDLCSSVSLQIQTLPGLRVLDYPMYLRPITGKLPIVFQHKWTDQAYRLLKKATNDGLVREYPTFSQFAEFLDELADKLCDPYLRPIQDNELIVKSTERVQQEDSHSKPVQGHSDQDVLCPCHPYLIGDAAHRLSKCYKFKNIVPTTVQIEILKDNPDFCRSCLERGHKSACTANIKCDRCDRKHYPFLHDACVKLELDDQTPHSYSAITQASLNSTICPAQQIYCKTPENETVTLCALHDSGSNVSLVTHDMCTKLGLRHIPDAAVTLNIEVLGGDTISTSAHRYQIPIFNDEGTLLTSISAYAIERIGSDLPAVDLKHALRIFGLQPGSNTSYPSGKVHVLIGMDNAHVAPSIISRVNGMVLAESVLGKLIYGTHPTFSVSSENFSYKVTLKPNDLRLDLVPSLLSTGVLGMSCTPKCSGCSCKQCPPDNAPHTLQERYDYEQIKSSMTLENGIVTASYPYIRDSTILPDNHELALRTLHQTERPLAKDPHHAIQYQEQIDKIISRGVLCLLTKHETSWKALLQYVSHKDVIKPGSAPTRLVFDPSAQFQRTLTAHLPLDQVTSDDPFKPIAYPQVRTIPCQIYEPIQTLGEHSPSDPEKIARQFLASNWQTSMLLDNTSSHHASTYLAMMTIISGTAGVLHACSWKSGSASVPSRLAAPDAILPRERAIAHLFWIHQAQRPLLAENKSGMYASLMPYLHDHGIWRINGRSPATSSYHSMLLSDQHPISRPIVIAIHRRCHDGRRCLKVRRLAPNVRADCQLCTPRGRKLREVPMAPLPVSRVQSFYPFEHSSCDSFAPISLKLEGRVTRNKTFNDDKLKANGILFTCLSTTAVHPGAMQGQDPDAFLLAYRRVIAVCGQPKTIERLRHFGFRRFGAENGMIWTFTSPGSPWANGVTESMIKSVKRSLLFILPAKTPTILELQTVFAELSELLNERPIGPGGNHFTGEDFDCETYSYICPSQLRSIAAQDRVPGGPFDSSSVLHANRFLANQTDDEFVYSE